MQNKNYAKLLENGTLEYAPLIFKIGTKTVIPRLTDDNFFFKHGYYKVVDLKPEYDTAVQAAIFSKWIIDEENHQIKSEYTLIDVNTPVQQQVKRYSKLKITLFCIEQGIWEQVKEYLIKIGFYDLFVMAQFFLETDEYFVKGLQMYAQSAVDENTTEDDVNDLIEKMKNFAHDGYVILDDEGDIIGFDQ